MDSELFLFYRDDLPPDEAVLLGVLLLKALNLALEVGDDEGIFSLAGSPTTATLL